MTTKFIVYFSQWKEDDQAPEDWVARVDQPTVESRARTINRPNSRMKFVVNFYIIKRYTLFYDNRADFFYLTILFT